MFKQIITLASLLIIFSTTAFSEEDLNQQLCSAVLSRNVDKVVELLDEKTDPNFANCKHWTLNYTLLELAAVASQVSEDKIDHIFLKTANQLFDHGADLPSIAFLKKNYGIQEMDTIRDIWPEPNTYPKPIPTTWSDKNAFARKFLRQLYINVRTSFDEGILKAKDLHDVKLAHESHCALGSFKGVIADQNPDCHIPHNANMQRALIIALLREDWEELPYLIEALGFKDSFINHDNYSFEEIIQIFAFYFIPWSQVDRAMALILGSDVSGKDVELRTYIDRAFDLFPDEMAALAEKLKAD